MKCELCGGEMRQKWECTKCGICCYVIAWDVKDKCWSVYQGWGRENPVAQGQRVELKNHYVVLMPSPNRDSRYTGGGCCEVWANEVNVKNSRKTILTTINFKKYWRWRLWQ